MPKKVLVIGSEKLATQIRTLLISLDIGVDTVSSITKTFPKGAYKVVIFDNDAYLEDEITRLNILEKLQQLKKKYIVVSSRRQISAVEEARKFKAVDYIVSPLNTREFIQHINCFLYHKLRICCIGGGTGLFNLLLSLKDLPGVLITSIVNMSDDGGSSGRLRASLGVLPPGDVRRSLVALSNAPQVMNDLMRHRFEKGDGISGHNLGNLLLAALEEIRGSTSEAIRSLADILNIKGIVLPVTTMPATLCALFDDGSEVKGENKIDLGEGRPPKAYLEKVWHEPQVECDINAYAAILNADLIVIGPGDLYTSVITNLLVKGIREALINSSAKKVYACNLMTKLGETSDFDALRHIHEIIKYLGGDFLDFVIVSNTKFTGNALADYAALNQFPVASGEKKEINRVTKAAVILADVGDENELVRHDTEKLKTEFKKILKKI